MFSGSPVWGAVEVVIAMPMPRVADRAKGRRDPENISLFFLTAYTNVCGHWWFGLGDLSFIGCRVIFRNWSVFGASILGYNFPQ